MNTEEQIEAQAVVNDLKRKLAAVDRSIAEFNDTRRRLRTEFEERGGQPYDDLDLLRIEKLHKIAKEEAPFLVERMKLVMAIGPIEDVPF